MNAIERYFLTLTTVLLSMAGLLSCSVQEEPDYNEASRGVPAVMDVMLQEIATEASTRATINSSDQWTVASFDVGDKAAFYTLGGIQNPDNPEDFSFTATNAEVFCQSKTSTTYRFGNSDIVLDPQTLGTYYSRLFYPYYDAMPLPTDPDGGPGLKLRVKDTDDIEKCVDFMMTETDKLSVSNGSINPKFMHNFCPLYVKRGEGFQNAPDKRVWIVMREPFTHVRVTQADPEKAFTYTLQYFPEVPEDELMIYILPGESKFKVNKYCVWEGWNGNNGDLTQNVLIPTGPSVSQKIYFVYIQDDYGNWQNVDDFYLYTSGTKTLQSGYSYTLTISLKGVDVVARPISVVEWNEEVEITDNRKMGINDYVEYNEWVKIYNSYIDAGRPHEMEEDLSKFGEAVHNTVTDRTSWTFLINHDIDFPNNDFEFSQVKRLDDALEGSSSYSRYRISNLHGALIGELTENGSVSSLELRDIYFIQPETETTPFSPFIIYLNGGTVENCAIQNAIIVSGQPAGIVAGSANGGTVKKCIFSGDVIGSESAEVDGRKGLFGIVESTPAVVETNTSGLKFIEN